jgi:hypothetical protein
VPGRQFLIGFTSHSFLLLTRIPNESKEIMVEKEEMVKTKNERAFSPVISSFSGSSRAD